MYVASSKEGEEICGVRVSSQPRRADKRPKRLAGVCGEMRNGPGSPGGDNGVTWCALFSAVCVCVCASMQCLVGLTVGCHFQAAEWEPWLSPSVWSTDTDGYCVMLQGW